VAKINISTIFQHKINMKYQLCYICICLIKSIRIQMLVAHACNPSYSGGTDQEDHGSKPAQAKIPETLSQKTHQKKEMVEWGQAVGPEFKPQYCKNPI
jgi:hypothetical protein